MNDILFILSTLRCYDGALLRLYAKLKLKSLAKQEIRHAFVQDSNTSLKPQNEYNFGVYFRGIDQRKHSFSDPGVVKPARFRPNRSPRFTAMPHSLHSAPFSKGALDFEKILTRLDVHVGAADMSVDWRSDARSLFRRDFT